MALEISKIITDWVPSQSKVIDFGCGDGSLLKDLIDTKNICGYGVEIDPQMINECIEKGISVIEKDIDKGIQDFELSNFDIAIMASSIQCLKNPNIAMRRMLRLSNKCHAIASPSLSSSLANQTISAADACFFNCLTTSFLSLEIIYFGLKLLSTSIPISFEGKSEI